MRTLLLSTVLLTVCTSVSLNAQIVINEGSNRNGTIIMDEDGDYEDWIEIYNAGAADGSLSGYSITDDSTDPTKWTFPDMPIPAGGFNMLFASGKDRKPVSDLDHWEQPVSEFTTWKYLLPTAATPATWIQPGYDDTAWGEGLSSIGYGDGDDATVVPEGTRTVYMRYTFDVADTALIGQALLSIDFDDGFVAYLNGHVIAMYGFAAGSPAYNAFSDADHEAAMYAGGVPESFTISEDSVKAWIVEGANVLAVEVHNVTAGSSDLTARPFFSIGVKVPDILWTDVLPWWFTTAPVSSNLHTNFKIGSEGEMIYLFDASGALADSLWVYVADADQSVGRETDGADAIGIFITPTPGASNGGAVYAGYTTGVVTFSLDAGFYDGDQSVSVTIPAGTEGHYTLNGAVPTAADALVTGPITISENTVLRVRLFDEAGSLLPGRTFTNTYFIDEDIVLPVLSISTNDENLYGATGIFDNWWTDWKKLCYIEYFDTAGVNQFEQFSGFKVDGGAGGSRGHAQKSMRIEPDNSAYGDGILNYPLIPRRWFVDEYETFYLRNGSNMHNVLPYKDAFMMRTTEGTYNEHMAYTPVVTFINGEYWGMYELRNKLDDGHFLHTKDIEKDSLDLMSVSYWYGLVLRAVDGSVDDFIAMREYLGYYPTPSDSSFYYIADSLLNLQNFTDYIIAETWFANLDWPYNNIKAWRDRGGDNKWNYAIIDCELGLGEGAWSDVNTNLINGLFSTQQYIEPLAALLQNPIYHDYFVNRYADLMNTTFQPTRTLAMEDSMYAEMYPEFSRQLERWGWGSIAAQLATFEDYRESLRNDFEVRTNKVRTHIKNGFDLNDKVEITLDVFPPEAGYIKISTIYIDAMPWTGVYFDGVPVQITAYPNTGYTFDHWGDSEFIDDVLNNSFRENITENTTFTAYFTGAPAAEQITIDEVNYHAEPTVDAGSWIELLNHGTAAVNISLWKLKDSDPLHIYTIPEGTILEPGVRMVIAEDMLKFAILHPDVTNVLGPLGFGLSNMGEEIYLFDRRDSMHIHFTYGDDLPWPVGADGHGRTLQRTTPGAVINLPGSWFDGCIGGSPGVPYTPCDDAVVFSEVNYNSHDDLNTGDWIELRNISASPVDISGWTFMDDSTGVEHTYVIPEGTILDPAAHHVLAQSGALFTALHPDIDNVDTSFVFNLGEGGEWIRMYDADGILILSLDYDDLSPWPSVADGAGYTLELVDSMGVMNSGDNWTAICYGGSPGEYAMVPCAEDPVSVINSSESSIAILPNPVTDAATLIVVAPAPTRLIMDVFNTTGVSVMHMENTVHAAGEYRFLLPVQELPAGMYQIAVRSQMGVMTMPLVKQ